MVSEGVPIRPVRRRRTLLDVPIDGEMRIGIFSAGRVIVEASPSARRLTISESLRSDDFPLPISENDEIRIGDASIIFQNRKYEPPALTRVTIPAATAARTMLSLITRGTSVDLYGTIATPLRIGDVMFFHSTVRGSSLSLTGGDFQVVGADASFVADGVGMEPSARGAHHTMQMPDGGVLDFDCSGGAQPLVIITEAPEAINITGVSDLVVRGTWGSEQRPMVVRSTTFSPMPPSRCVA